MFSRSTYSTPNSVGSSIHGLQSQVDLVGLGLSSSVSIVRVQAVLNQTPAPNGISAGTVVDGVTTAVGDHLLVTTSVPVMGVTTKVGQFIVVSTAVPATAPPPVYLPPNAMVIVENGTVHGKAVYVTLSSGALLQLSSAAVV